MPAPRLGPKAQLLRDQDISNAQVYVEHPAVQARTRREADEWRTRHGVIVLDDSGDAPPKPVLSFEEAPFPDWAADTLRREGHAEPTPIQAQLWPAAALGRDVIGIAATGSGKTLAYALPVLVHAVVRPGLGEGPRCMVIVPTAELAVQTRDVMAPFAQAGGASVRLMGWEAVDEGYDREATVAVGTPQQFAELVAAKHPILGRLAIVAVDEADALCEAPHRYSLNAIFARLPESRQLLMISATWPDNAYHFGRAHCRQNMLALHAGTTGLSASRSVVQHFEMILNMTKQETLVAAIRKAGKSLADGAKAIVFCNEPRTADEVFCILQDAGHAVLCVHENVPEIDRFDAIRRFQEAGNEPIMVATSLIGRGHNFPWTRFVINYDMPSRIVEYVHRIGRCGRSGVQGYAMSFLEAEDYHHACDLACLIDEAGRKVPPEIKGLADSLHHGGSSALALRRSSGPLAYRCSDRRRGAGLRRGEASCRRPRMRPGDWLCIACGAHQYASRTQCRWCSEPRPPGAGLALCDGEVEAALPGDGDHCREGDLEVGEMMQRRGSLQPPPPRARSLCRGHGRGRARSCPRPSSLSHRVRMGEEWRQAV
mmetsp:Transcript_96454/g.241870  ORF Transcript_96454/g.241870 Transcript_96454/m.241870 type:complete len:598 (-) Transcript_96454:39-1832(-)